MLERTISIDAIEIEAPIDLVWKVLSDFQAYSQWNPFTVAIQTNFVPGDDMTISIQQGRDKVVHRNFVLETLDPPYLLEWSLPKLGHRLLFSAWRSQRLTSLSEHTCSYQTSDTFKGLLAPWIYNLQKDWVEKNFNRMARALKSRCEQLARHENR